MHKSTITDHMTQHNHIVDWEGAKFIDRESDWRTRGIKEAIWIRKTKDRMNRDEGRYRLSHIYADLLKGQWATQGAAAVGTHQSDTSV